MALRPFQRLLQPSRQVRPLQRGHRRAPGQVEQARLGGEQLRQAIGTQGDERHQILRLGCRLGALIDLPAKPTLKPRIQWRRLRINALGRARQRRTGLLEADMQQMHRPGEQPRRQGK